MKIPTLFVFAFLTTAFVFSPINNFSQIRKKTNIETPSSKSAGLKAAFSSKIEMNVSVSKSLVQNPLENYVSSEIEQAILDEINTARREPQKYIQYLKDYRKLFKGNTAYLPNNVWKETKEGVVPIDESISLLKTLSQLNPYGFSNGMNRAANMQLKDLMENNALGHFGKDGSDLQKRLGRFGTVNGNYAENLAFYTDTARDVVLMMIVDDNVKSRAHRKNIFSPNFKMIGISFGKGKSGESLCVINFADGFSDSNLTPGVREL